MDLRLFDPYEVLGGCVRGASVAHAGFIPGEKLFVFGVEFARLFLGQETFQGVGVDAAGKRHYASLQVVSAVISFSFCLI